MQVDARGGQGVRGGVVMIEFYAEMGAHVVKTVARQPESLTRAPDRAEKGRRRRDHSRRAAAAVQDASVKAGVVGRQIVRPLQKGGKTGPELGEGGAVPEHGPGESVDFREINTGSRRADERVQRVLHAPVPDPGHAQGAGAVRSAIGGFKIQSHNHGIPGAVRAGNIFRRGVSHGFCTSPGLIF